jgi:tubulin polyglutamylase TTLL4
MRAFDELNLGKSEISKVEHFIAENPVSNAFLKREKGRLPYSVFKPTADTVKFIKSEYPDRPPAVFFSYPTYVNVKHPQEDKADIREYNRRQQIERLFFSFLNSDRTHIYNAVVNTCKFGGFELIERGNDFNLIWTGYTTIEDILALNKYQKINHFPNSITLGRKDLFWRQNQQFKLMYPSAFNITPHSWILPDDYNEFEAFRKSSLEKGQYFILKPTASSCGRGIRVVPGYQKVTNREETLISAYVDKPLLINNKKFDMRMYVLVTSFNPLRAYLYNEGLARFATEEYSNDAEHLRNKYMHLTNFSINKRNVKAYVRNDQKRPRN